MGLEGRQPVYTIRARSSGSPSQNACMKLEITQFCVKPGGNLQFPLIPFGR